MKIAILFCSIFFFQLNLFADETTTLEQEEQFGPYICQTFLIPINQPESADCTFYVNLQSYGPPRGPWMFWHRQMSFGMNPEISACNFARMQAQNYCRQSIMINYGGRGMCWDSNYQCTRFVHNAF